MGEEFQAFSIETKFRNDSEYQESDCAQEVNEKEVITDEMKELNVMKEIEEMKEEFYQDNEAESDFWEDAYPDYMIRLRQEMRTEANQPIILVEE